MYTVCCSIRPQLLFVIRFFLDTLCFRSHEPLLKLLFLFDLKFSFISILVGVWFLWPLAVTLFTAVGARFHMCGVFKIFILTPAGDFRLLDLYILPCVACDVRRYGVAPSVGSNWVGFLSEEEDKESNLRNIVLNKNRKMDNIQKVNHYILVFFLLNHDNI
jgi:hypothetical protein